MLPLLSIAIPVYNQEKYIGKLLDSIVFELSSVDKKLVEVVISDNASTDNTVKIVEAYRSKISLFTINQNIENIGADQNFLKIISLSRGEYCWLMGSDDCIIPGSLKHIQNAIVGSPDIILCERIDCDINLNPFRSRHWIKNAKNVNYSYNGENWGKYFDQVIALGGVFSYLGAIIVRRDRWVQINFDTSYIGTAYAHVFILLHILKMSAVLKYLAVPLVYCRMGNDSFSTEGAYKRCMLDFNGYKKLSEDVFSEFPETQVKLKGILTREYGSIAALIGLFYHINKQTGIVSTYRFLKEFRFKKQRILICGVLFWLYPIAKFIKRFIRL